MPLSGDVFKTRSFFSVSRFVTDWMLSCIYFALSERPFLSVRSPGPILDFLAFAFSQELEDMGVKIEDPENLKPDEEADAFHVLTLRCCSTSATPTLRL